MGGKGREKDAMRRSAEAQERTAKAQERLAGTAETRTTEDRAFAEQIRQELGPFAEALMDIFTKGGTTAEDIGEYPERPDLVPYYQQVYKDRLAGITDEQAETQANLSDYAFATGTQRTGVPGRNLGAVAGMASKARTEAFQDLKDREASEQLEGYAANVQRFRDLLTKRGQDVGIATTGANIKQGQQAFFDPNITWSQALRGQGAAGAGHRGAAGTQYKVAQLPGKWSWLGGAAKAGLDLAGDVATGGWSRAAKAGAGALS